MNRESLYYEWTIDQWAEAAAWFELRRGWLPLPNAEGALVIWKEWIDRRQDMPGPPRIVITVYAGHVKPELPRNKAWAFRLWRHAISDAFPAALRPARPCFNRV